MDQHRVIPFSRPSPAAHPSDKPQPPSIEQLAFAFHQAPGTARRAALLVLERASLAAAVIDLLETVAAETRTEAGSSAADPRTSPCPRIAERAPHRPVHHQTRRFLENLRVGSSGAGSSPSASGVERVERHS